MSLFSIEDVQKYFPGFIEAGKPSLKRFETFPESDRNKLLLSIIGTMAMMYNGLHYFIPNSTGLGEEELKKQLASQVLPAWRHGLSGCSVSQIVSGLFLVTGGRTEYVEFPPSSVLKFRAICTSHQPGYHDTIPAPSNSARIGWDKEEAQKRVSQSARHAMIRMARMMGHNTKAMAIMKLICERNELNVGSLDDVEMEEEEQQAYDLSACRHLEYCEQIKKYGRIVKDVR